MRKIIRIGDAAALCLLFLASPALTAEASAPSPECGGAPPQLQSIMKTHTMALYPTESQARGEEGLVKLSVHVDKDGTPDNVRVTASSSFRLLDDAIVKHIKQVWRWEPLRPECRETGATASVAYSWNLSGSMPIAIYSNNPLYPAEAREKNITGWGAASVDVSETGKPLAAHVVTTTGSPILDEAMQNILMAQTYSPQAGSGGPHSFIARVQIQFRRAPSATQAGTAENSAATAP